MTAAQPQTAQAAQFNAVGRATCTFEMITLSTIKPTVTKVLEEAL
jgi:hypothetical protein